MKNVLNLSTLLGVVVLAASPAKNITFQWPDSSHYWRVLINVNQYIDSYLKNHPQYFVHDKLVTDFNVRDVPANGREQAAKQYKSVRKKLEARGMAVGTYVSGSTVVPEAEQTFYPPANVSIEQMPPNTKYSGSWPGHTTRKIVDVSDADTRHALQAGIRQLWENVPAPVRFVDNVPAHRRVSSSTPPWEVTCKHMAELRKIAESLGSRVVFNIPMHVGEVSDQEAQQLMDAVGQNGIALEMPWSEGIRKNPEATKRAANRYRQFLDSGMAIILIAVKTPEDQLKAWVGSWRKPTDHIYIASPFFKPPDMSIYMLQ
jgi:hypothetical protein